MRFLSVLFISALTSLAAARISFTHCKAADPNWTPPQGNCGEEDMNACKDPQVCFVSCPRGTFQSAWAAPDRSCQCYCA
ncbi:hypothetical protein TUN199_07947 [Pyrenophora tritici-repentis]|nr:hypothetical protein PtrV1_09761 [Pyrenophora tritici-repentis]KAI0578435.1 hypothetical protein Alg130_07953 [Pyrenophora tritici-repentis]KAI0579012.1 hypothetical protein Alg215_06028 [Pyrenophora tritici-repentis]KAI0607797.1 hypothetical protein TUN205_07967 [Pyrenophora tritici-repentis]KAI0620073.1 hypothetical protein TUN199_07947 [Pyrenophora tritici-repentis]